MRINAVSVLGLSIFQIYSAMLQGLNKIKAPTLIMAGAMLAKLILTLILTPLFGIVGSTIAAVCGNVLAGAVIFGYFVKFTRLEKRLVKNVSVITLCGVIMGLPIFIASGWMNSFAAVAAVGLFAGLVYFAAVFVTRVFSREEWQAMPLSGLLVRLDKKINGG